MELLQVGRQHARCDSMCFVQCTVPAPESLSPPFPKYNCEVPITGVWGRPGAESLVKVSGGKAPLKLKHFWFWTFSGSRKVLHFSKNLKCNKIRYNLCYLCKKCKQMMFNSPQYVTDYCTMKKSNRLVRFG